MWFGVIIFIKPYKLFNFFHVSFWASSKLILTFTKWGGVACVTTSVHGRQLPSTSAPLQIHFHFSMNELKINASTRLEAPSRQLTPLKRSNFKGILKHIRDVFITQKHLGILRLPRPWLHPITSLWSRFPLVISNRNPCGYCLLKESKPHMLFLFDQAIITGVFTAWNFITVITP